MFSRAGILLMAGVYALAIQAAAQAPAPTTTAFDGIYIGTATTASGRAALSCARITSVDMTITGEQVVIHEALFTGGRWTFQGSVNAAGEISTAWYKKVGLPDSPTVDSLVGKIEDKVFVGQHLHGYWCRWGVHMAPPPAPTMPFDGDYIGVSRESSNTASNACPPNAIPATLIIRNGIVRGGTWQGNVNPQGVVVVGNRLAPRVDGQIDSQGTIRAQGSSSNGGCTVSFVWRKQSG